MPVQSSGRLVGGLPFVACVGALCHLYRVTVVVTRVSPAKSR